MSQALSPQELSPSQIADIRLATKKMHGAERRAFQAEMALKYCRGSARQTERVFGWKRTAVALGLAERRTGITCIGSQSTHSGRKRWEEQHPEAAEALRQLAEAHVQQDPTFNSTIGYTRLSAAEAIAQLKVLEFKSEQLPSVSTMAEVLNRMGYRLRPVVKAKPQKKIPETDAIFSNIKAKAKELDDAYTSGQVRRLSVDSKASVNRRDYSRGGLTRGNNQAADHDMGSKETYIPFGIVDEDTGQLLITFGSSYKTSDFIVDCLEEWWQNLPHEEQKECEVIQLKIDNGSESSGVRTQFLKRMVDFGDTIGKSIQLLYYPPYHSKYNPIERCWGILELHWNGTLLSDVETMLAWASSMTWKGIHPIVNLSLKVYEKGISLSKKAARLKNDLNVILCCLNWDILIRPALRVLSFLEITLVHLNPLTPLQEDILALLDFSTEIYTRLAAKHTQPP